MAQEKITIKFIPDGHTDLIKALNNLAKAQREVQNVVASAGKVVKGATVTTQKFSTIAAGLTTKLKAQGLSWKKLGVEANLVKRAYKGNKLAIEKLRVAMKQGHNGSRLLHNSFATLRSQLLLFQFAMAMGVRQLVKFADQAAKIESMSRAFNTLAGGGETATIAMDKLKVATDGTMSQFDLFQQANNAMILGVTKNSDEMAEMFDIAQRLGRALGVDTKLSVESLIVGIGRQSRMMLDNIGIVTDVEKANAAYAKQLDKSKDELTDTERRQAFLNATMEAAREKLATMPAEIASTQDAYDSLRASASDASVALGELFAQLLLLPEVSQGSASILREFADNIDNISLAARTALTLFFGLPVEFRKTAEAMGEISENIGETFEIPDLELSMDALRIPDDAIISWDKYLQKQKESEQINVDYQSSLNKIHAAFLENEEAMNMAVSGFSNMTSAMKGELDARMKNEMDALKATSAYQRADSDRRKTMEEGVTKKFASERTRLAKFEKASNLAQAGMNIAEGITRALSKANIPLAVLLGIMGAVQVTAIASTPIPKFATGGMIGGRRHSQGGTMIEAEQGEYIMSRNAVVSVGLENLNRMNQGGGGGAVTVNVSGNVLSQDFVEGELAENIKEAVRRGTDFGIS